MDLLLVTNQFPTNGGDSIFIQEEWKVLLKHFEKIILVSRSKTHQIGVELPANVVLYWYDGPNLFSIIKSIPQIFAIHTREELIKAKNCPLKTYLKRVFSIIKFRLVELDFKRFLKGIKVERNTVAYTYWLSGATLALIKQKDMLGIEKVISRTHGAELYNERCKGGWQPFRNTIANELDELYFASEYAKNYFITQWGNINNKIREVAYLGSMTPKGQEYVTKINDEKIVLLSCSRVIPLKRIDLIISALELIPDNISVEWRHLGDGTEKENILRLAHEKLDKKKNVDWYVEGYLSHDCLEKYYIKYNVNLFISTSSTEGGTPISMLEAMSFGVPVIGTAVGGIIETFEDGCSGFLLSENPTPEEVCKKICDYSKMSVEKKRTLQENAKNRWCARFKAENNAYEFVQKIIE